MQLFGASSVRRAIPVVGIGRRSHGAEAMRRVGGYGARSAPALPAQWATMRMRQRIVRRLMRAIWMVGEDVIEPSQPGAQTMCGRLEHMFERVGGYSDGTGAPGYVPGAGVS